MKFRLAIAATLLLASCANQRPNDSKSTSNYNRDLSECEREAAVVGAGNKAKAFDNCMKAKGYAPKR
jgi:hypothetical protein